MIRSRRESISSDDATVGAYGPNESSNFISPLYAEGSLAPRVSLLTAGKDKPYALGMAFALSAHGVILEFIGSDEVDDANLHSNGRIRVYNLRGDQRVDVSIAWKVMRLMAYYARLICYSCATETRIFHILWNNKVEWFDRTVLVVLYRLLGKFVVLTTHNVNIGQRDGSDSWFNRLTLRCQYILCHHVFVHTEKMKHELVSDFKLSSDKVTVIPFGINNTVPTTALSTLQARELMGFMPREKVLLFFGNIAPYKGLEYLIAAFDVLGREDASYRLIIAGRPKGSFEYWGRIRQTCADRGLTGRIVERIEFVPDDETELYFKAADVLVLPYTEIFQSGVLFLGYSFGLPVIASDVGSLKEDVVEGETGFVCQARDAADLATTIRKYFASDLYLNLSERRRTIQQYANERYSWCKVASLTTAVYSRLLERCESVTT